MIKINLLEPSKKHFLKVYDLKNGASSNLGKVIQLEEYQTLLSFKQDNKIYIYFPSKRIVIDWTTMNSSVESLPVKLSYISGWLNNPFPSSKYFYQSIDANKDGIQDFLFENSNSQICCIDGKNNDILFATPQHEHFFDWASGYNIRGEPVLIVNNNSTIKTYVIKKNPFAKRLLANRNLLGFVGFSILLPLLIFFIYRSNMYILTFRALAYHIEVLGFCLVRKTPYRKKTTIRIYNKTFVTLVKSFPVQKVYYKKGDLVIPKEIDVLLDNFDNHGKENPKHLDIYFFNNLNERVLVKASVYRLNKLGLKRYFLITIYEATDKEKLQMYNMTLYSVHNVKNNLGVIQNIVENLSYEFENKNLLDYTKKFQKIMKHIDSIVNNLKSILVVSNIYSPKYEELDLNKVVDEWIIENCIEKMPTDVEFKSSFSNEPLKVFFDKKQLSLALISIVDNSIKAVQKSKIKRILFRTLRYSNGDIGLEVEDSGPGIVLNVINSLHTETYRNDNLGTGLGLKIVKKICELNNAKFIIESKETFGTNVKIIFINKDEKK